MRPLLLRPPLFDFFSSSELIGLPLCRPGVLTATWNRRPAEVGLDLCNDIFSYRILWTLIIAEKINSIVGRKFHVSFFPIDTTSTRLPVSLYLAATINHGDAFNLNFE